MIIVDFPAFDARRSRPMDRVSSSPFPRAASSVHFLGRGMIAAGVMSRSAFTSSSESGSDAKADEMLRRALRSRLPALLGSATRFIPSDEIAGLVLRVSSARINEKYASAARSPRRCSASARWRPFARRRDRRIDDREVESPSRAAPIARSRVTGESSTRRAFADERLTGSTADVRSSDQCHGEAIS